MHYEINVSYKGLHLFATTERSLRDLYKTARVFKKLKAAFSEEKGYKINVTQQSGSGEDALDAVLALATAMERAADTEQDLP